MFLTKSNPNTCKHCSWFDASCSGSSASALEFASPVEGFNSSFIPHLSVFSGVSTRHPSIFVFDIYSYAHPSCPSLFLCTPCSSTAIFGKQRRPVFSSFFCLHFLVWEKTLPPVPHMGSSQTRGDGQSTPQQGWSHCPTFLSHTACTGHAGCRGCGVAGGTGRADSSPRRERQSQSSPGAKDSTGTRGLASHPPVSLP